MYAGTDFNPFDQVESLLLGIDLVNDLPAGDSVVSGTWTLSVADDSAVIDPSPSSRLIAGPFITGGTVISYRVSGCLANCRYIAQGVATTDQGNTISLFTHIPGESVT